MAANEIRKNDIGTLFKVTINDGSATKDISYATTKQFIFKKPDGTIKTVTAGFYTDGTDGLLSYTTVSGDLDSVGLWKLQARVASTNNDKRTDVASFRVNEILE